MDTTVILNQMIIIFILMMLGCILAKTSVITEEGSRLLSDLILTVLNPAIILSSAMDQNRAGGMKDILFGVVLALLLYAVLLVLGNVIPILLRCRRDEKRIYNLMTVFGNIGFIGIPLVAAVLGKGAVIFVTVFNLPYNVLIYTYGVYLMTKGTEKQKLNWKGFFSPGTVASILGLLIFAFQIPMPEVVSSTADYLGNAITPLSMLVIGVSLSELSIKDIFNNFRLYLFCILRMLVVPLAVAICLKPFVQNEILYQVSVLLVAMPVGSMPVILAKQYDTDVNQATKGVVLSTILSIITVPIVAILL